MADVKVKYLGPARKIEVDGKDRFPGDSFSLSERQLSILARPPVGTGRHLFDVADDDAERVGEMSVAAANLAAMPEHIQKQMIAMGQVPAPGEKKPEKPPKSIANTPPPAQ